ncbi:MAG: TolC family protein [Vicinamibacterales bacterium]
MAIAAMVAGVPPVSAQQARNQPEAAEQAPQAPVMRFPDGKVSLEQAVKLTLEHQPALKQAEAALQLQEGVAQEQRGAFDWTLFAKIFYSYRQQELPESRKEIERKKRNDIRRGLEQNRQTIADARTLQTTLQQARNTPGNTPYDAIGQVDPEIAAELKVLDLLIQGNAGNAAVAQGLRDERDKLIDRLLTQINTGLTKAQQGAADAQTLLNNLGEAPAEEFFYNFNGQLQVNRLFRNGIQFTPFFQGNVDYTNFIDKPRSSDFGGKGIEPLYTFKAGYSATLPLRRGRGADATGGAERAARIEIDARKLAYQHQADLSTFDTVLAYWDLRAAQDNAAIAQESLKRQSQLVQLTQAQADAGSIPRIELSRAQAGEARARGRVDETARALHEARVALAQAIGLAVTEEDATLPMAGEAFPGAPAPAQLAEPAVTAVATDAIDRRSDLQAAVASERSGQVLVDAAETFLRSRLDLVNKTYWTSLDELVKTVPDPTDPDGLRRINESQGFGAALDRWVGPSVELSLEFEKPLGNNQARGRLLQREADLRRRQISTNDLRRMIRLGVVKSARSLNEALSRLTNADSAVKFYQATIDGEMERFRAGDITLIDAILTVEQQTEALLTQNSARQQVAQLLAELRFESGQILSHAPGQKPTVDPNALVTVPAAGARR